MRGFCQQRGIEMFDRVVRLRAEWLNAEEAGIRKENLADLRYLREIKLSSGSKEYRDATLVTLKEAIPECRLEKLRNNEVEHEGKIYPQDVTATLNFASCSSAVPKSE
jgi:hypothetical protein